MLICPSFFDGRFDGIGRVSGAYFGALKSLNNGVGPYVLSANDSVGSCTPDVGRCYARKHVYMLLDAFTLRSPALRHERRAARNPVICTHLGLSPVARVISFRQRRPYAVFIHGVESWKRLPRRSRWGLIGAERLFFNSEFTRSTFFRFNSWARELPSVVIPLGLTLSESRSVGIAAKLEHNGGALVSSETREQIFTVLIVGRMTKAEYYEDFRDATDLYKGFKQLILALGLLARSMPSVRLWIVGDGDARPDLEAWLAARPERRLVEFFGKISDDRLHELYGQADVFALPSEGEGFGLVYVEAMAHGLPCVCVGAGASPEVVKDGITGLVARPRDVEDLADKLFVLANNDKLRARISRAARQAYESEYTAEAFENRIVQAIDASFFAQRSPLI